MADVQRVRGGIEADIGGDAPRQRARVERLEVRALVDESAVLKGPQEVGAGRCHRFTGSCWLEAAACGGRRHLTQSPPQDKLAALPARSEENTSEFPSLMRISYALFRL